MSILQKTLNEVGFDNVFTEVIHSETLGLINPNDLRLFCLNVSSNMFKFDDLHELLLDNIGRYIFSRAKIDNFYVEKQEQKIALKALEILRKSAKYNSCFLGDELGDILLYIFLEKVLGAPKLCSKLETLAHGNSISIKSGVHLLPLDEDLPSYQMVFGASNIVGDVKDAIDNAFSTIKSLKTESPNEGQLVENLIFAQSFDHFTIKKLKENILPDGRPKPPIDRAFGVFLGYKLGLDPTKRSNLDFRNALKAKMELDVKEHIEYIKQKIKDSSLEAHSFYFYILPFNDADLEKDSIMNALLGGTV